MRVGDTRESVTIKISMWHIIDAGVSRILFLLRCNVFTVPESIPACYRFPFLLLPSLRPSPLKPHEHYTSRACA